MTEKMIDPAELFHCPELEDDGHEGDHDGPPLDLDVDGEVGE